MAEIKITEDKKNNRVSKKTKEKGNKDNVDHLEKQAKRKRVESTKKLEESKKSLKDEKSTKKRNHIQKDFSEVERDKKGASKKREELRHSVEEVSEKVVAPKKVIGKAKNETKPIFDDENSKKENAKKRIAREEGNKREENLKEDTKSGVSQNKDMQSKSSLKKKENGLSLKQGKKLKQQLILKKGKKIKQQSVTLDGFLKKQNKKEKKRIKELTLTVDIFDVLIAIIATAIFSCVITGFILNMQYKKNNLLYASNLTSNTYIGKFIKIYSEVVDNFYEEVEEDGLIEAAIDGMIKHLEDTYSIYMNKEDGSSFTENLDDKYEGIGVIAYGNLIYSVIPKSPAEEVGLQEGDLIIQINGIEINEENYNSVADIIGDSEEDIQLKVVRDNKELDFTIQKSTVVMNVVEGQTLKKNKKTIGYIQLSSFGAASYNQFQEELNRLEQENIEALIIDLRGNTGGYLNMAFDISSLFLEKGKLIYSLENKNGVTDYKDKTDEKRDYAIVVIVNESTASAAEILTAALKDSYGASVVGKKTYGKGKVQNVIQNEGSVVKYTSAKWLRPNGECIDEVGIVPDFEITNVIKDEIIYDKQLEKAIELLS